MKKVSKQVEQRELCVVGVKTVDCFITDDGREWCDEQAATAHEAKVKEQAAFTLKYRVRVIDICEVKYDAAYIREINDNVLMDFVYHYENLTAKGLQLGWNLLYLDNTGDYMYTSCALAIDMLKELEINVNKLKDLVAL